VTTLFRKLHTATIESGVFRRATRTRTGRRLLRSSPWARLRQFSRGRAIATSRRRLPHLFVDTRTCFLFVGHTKSGGTLLGSLLDAHSRVMCADELGLAAALVDIGDADVAFRLVARNAEREAQKGRVTARRLEPYTFAVPGQSQGLVAPPLAVGDSRAGPTTRFLASQPDAVPRIRRVLGPVSLRLVHVVRNPFDPIAVMVVRGGRDVGDAIADYRAQCERLVSLAMQMSSDELTIIRYEDVVDDVSQTLAHLCRFIGVEPDETYLAACREVIDSKPRRDRDRIMWDRSSIAAVESVIDAYPFLGGYRFEAAR